VRRLAALCAASGEPRIAPRDVLHNAIARLRELVAFITREAAAGAPRSGRSWPAATSPSASATLPMPNGSRRRH
jgi:hypothetical protein